MKLYQQGDVLCKTISIPAGAGKKDGKKVLAEGEATGHAHVVEGDAELLELGDRLFLRVLSGNARVIHEEHKPIEIPPGEYEIERVREYDHFREEARQVVD